MSSIFQSSCYVLIRHGEAENEVNEIFNSDPSHIDYTQSHLTEKGIWQITQIAHFLLRDGIVASNVYRAYTSQIPRAMESVDILAKEGVVYQDAVKKDIRLNDVHMGDLEGKSYVHHPRYDKSDRQFLKSFSKDVVECYHGESEGSITERVLGIFEEGIKDVPKGMHVLFITHSKPVEIISRSQNLSTYITETGLYCWHSLSFDAQKRKSLCLKAQQEEEPEKKYSWKIVVFGLPSLKKKSK